MSITRTVLKAFEAHYDRPIRTNDRLAQDLCIDDGTMVAIISEVEAELGISFSDDSDWVIVQDMVNAARKETNRDN